MCDIRLSRAGGELCTGHGPKTEAEGSQTLCDGTETQRYSVGQDACVQLLRGSLSSQVLREVIMQAPRRRR